MCLRGSAGLPAGLRGLQGSGYVSAELRRSAGAASELSRRPVRGRIRPVFLSGCPLEERPGHSVISPEKHIGRFL